VFTIIKKKSNGIATMNIEHYLERIQCPHLSKNCNPTLENLRLLQSKHLDNIPYENLDIHLGRHISLSVDCAYRKIIGKQRGGYCFELNPLFSWLLQELGYKCNFISCFNYDKLLKGFSTIPCHIAILVKLGDFEYYVDVGLPIDLQMPLELRENHVQCDKKNSSWRFLSTANGFVLQEMRTSNDWHSIVQFEPNQKLELVEFFDLNEYVQTSAHKQLYDHVICTKHVENGFIKLIDSTFAETVYGDRGLNACQNKKSYIHINDYKHIFRKYFGICVLEMD
jgi:N-hydroxyarylamine O-acetyltransferase